MQVRLFTAGLALILAWFKIELLQNIKEEFKSLLNVTEIWTGPLLLRYYFVLNI
jgi:hypothetical protein